MAHTEKTQRIGGWKVNGGLDLSHNNKWG